MGIHDDAVQGTLDSSQLAKYIASDPNLINALEPSSGRSPLALAAVAGFPDIVELLLKRGAKADALSRDGETALLLTTRDGSANRARIVQLLVGKMSPSAIDATTTGDRNKTPLMYSMLNKDRESLRLLVKAGADKNAVDDDGLTAAAMAPSSGYALALDPDKEQSAFSQLTNLVGSFLLYIVAWVNKTAKGVMNKLFGLNPTLNTTIDEQVNDGETPNKIQFLDNVDEYINDPKNKYLAQFFKDKPNYIQELAAKATALKEDSNTPIGQGDLLPKTIKVTLHQQVIYCDDSSSMKRDGRWDAQARLVKKIAEITTRVLPEGDGVALRFINQDTDNSEKLTLDQIGNTINSMSWKPGGDTPIGTNLKSKILQPMVYDKLEPKTLGRPLLISVITDGMPSQEDDNAFVDAIKECGVKLDQAGYPRQSVKFMIGQIGTARAATTFLQSVGNNDDIKDMVFVTADKLDDNLSKFKDNQYDLDRWLLETLFSPIQNSTV